MGKTYIDSDILASNFDEVIADLKGGSVSKLYDLVGTLGTVAKVSGDSAYYVVWQILWTFCNAVMSSRRTLVLPFMTKEMKERLATTTDQCVRDASHSIERIRDEVKNGAYDSKAILEAIGGVEKQAAILQREFRIYIQPRGVGGTEERNPLST